MIKRFQYISFSSVVLITLMMSLLLPTAALADVGSTPPPTNAVATQPAPTNVAPTNAAPTNAVATQPAPTNVVPTSVAPTNAVVLQTPVVPTVVATETPAGATQPVDLTGVVAAIANANAVVTDANGNPVLLVSQAAANALTVGDPTGCPPGIKPVSFGGTGAGCTSSYASIQVAINDGSVANGWTIYINAGTYYENVVINKSVTLQGAGIDQTIIKPAVSNPNCSGGGGGSLCAGASNVVLVQKDNVTIRDLTIDGDNPFLTSAVNVGGANIDARNGVITDHTLGIPIKNLEVDHVKVENIYLRGIYVSTTNGTFNIHNNIVANVQADPASIAIFNYGGSGVIANNTVSNANDAISANHSKGTQFLNNTVTNSGSGIHTDNYGDGGLVSTDVISGNTISNGPANSYGIFVFAPYAPVTVSNNTITNVDYGLTLSGSGWGVPINTVTFDHNTVNTNVADAYVTTDVWGYFSSNVNATFNNNIFTGGQYGIYLESQGAGDTLPGYYSNGCTGNCVLNVNGSNNSISGNTLAGVFFATGQIPWYGGGPDYNGTYTVDLRNNWWGCAGGPSTTGCDTVAGTVLYDPWLHADPFATPPAGGGGGGGGGALPLNIVAVTGGELVTLNTTISTTLRLPSGNQVSIDPGAGTTASVTPNTEASLPGALPGGDTFASAMTVSVMNGGAAVGTLPAGKTMEVSFVAPPLPAGQTFSILYWNPALNGGLGGWVEVPATVTSDGHVVATVDFTGTFVLVTK